MKQEFIVLLVSIFLLMNLSFQSSALKSKINEQNLDAEPFETIYVDDDNTQGPWDGTLEHPYRTIIDGVNNASEENTVFVFNGFYSNEYVYVRKSIKIVGEDKYNTILSGPSSAVEVEDTINHTVLNGFELSNFNFTNILAIYLFHCSDCAINDIIIDYSSRGVHLINCSNCVVSNNFIKTRWDNIVLRSSENNTINENQVYGLNESLSGVEFSAHSNDNIFSNNIVSNCESGIKVRRSERAMISDNKFINNTDFGIDFFVSSNSTILRNKITNNTQGMDISYSDDVIISDNIVKDNSLEGISLVYGKNIEISRNIIDNNICGISFCFIDNSVCANNTITNSSEVGIDIMDSDDITGNNLISDNNIKNCYCGILLDNSLGNTYKKNIVDYNEFGILIYGAAYFNVITKNEVRNNYVGIELYGFIQGKTYAPVDNYIVSNNVYENTNCGIYATILSIFNNIYYNNLGNNYVNAYDKGINIWYKFKPLGKSMGNYWDDYNGEDKKWPFGIGDTPYNIPPAPFRNKDRYPVMDPIDIENTQIQDISINTYTISEIQQITQQYIIDNGIIFQNNFNYLNI